jgi:zinc protease
VSPGSCVFEWATTPSSVLQVNPVPVVRYRGLRVLPLLFLLLIPTRVVAQSVADSAPIVLDTAVRRGILPNGLSFYIRHNAYPAQRAELRLVVDAGSIQEDEDQLGVAHLLEHMAFAGTQQFPGDSVWRFFERIGMSIGADVNATTGFDDTIYQVTIPTDDTVLLGQGIELLSDWVRGLAFDSLMLARERKVVLEEHRSGLGPQRRALERTIDLLLAGSPYPARLPIGAPELIGGVAMGPVQRFYRDWYRPERIAVVIVGDVDVARIERLIRTGFGTVNRSGEARAFPPPVVPQATIPRALVVADSELTVTTVTVNYREPRRSVLTRGDLRSSIARLLFDQLLNDRFRRRALDTAPPFIGAGAGSASFTRGTAFYRLSLRVQTGASVSGLGAVLDEVARATTDGFTAAEVERGRLALGRDIDQMEASQDRVTSGKIAATLAANHLQREPIADRAAQLVDARRALAALTEAEIRAAGADRLADRAPVVIAQGPREGAPGEAALLAQLSGPRPRLPAYDESGDESALLTALPTPGSVRRSSRVDAVGVTRLDLSNGVRVLLKPTTFDRSEVLLSAYRPGGFSLASDTMLVAAQTAPSLVCGSGMGSHDPVSLTRLLAGRVASLSCTQGETDEGFSGAAAPADLETLLQLIYLQLTAPRLDSQVVARYHTQLREALEHRAAEPMNALSDTLTLLLAGHHPRTRLFDSAFVRQVDAGRSLAWFRRRFTDATGLTFLLVGSFTPDSILPLLERYLGGLPAVPRPPDRTAATGAAPRGPATRLLHTGREPRATTVLVFHHAGPSTPVERLRIAALTHVLQHRLEAVLRRREGGVYSVGVDAEAVSVPTWSYRISIQFDAAPERRDELVALIHASILDIVAHGATSEELDAFRTERRRGRETGMQTNGWWLQVIARADQLGWPLGSITSDRDANRLDPTDLAAAADRYLRRKNLVEVALLPAR